jgi:hypothetical protein
MSGRALPWVLAGGAAAVVAYFATRRSRPDPIVEPHADRRLIARSEAELRNAGLIYRPIGATGERYPEWIRALDGKSGVYVIREIQRDGSAETVYVGESHRGRLYDTLTRHFQTWRRSKKFWSGQYGGQGHDPGLTYPRDRVTVAARVLSPARAMAEETRLIARLRPRDNLLKQPTDDSVEEVIPF